MLIFCIVPICVFAENKIYRIRDYVWNIEGKTDSFYLEKKINAEKEIEFSSREELSQYVEALEKKCSNLRLFEDFKTNLKITPSEISGRNDVVVEIDARESLSHAVVPYPKYSSIEGFKFKTKLKDMNFQGKLEKLEAELAFIMQKKTYEKEYRPGVGVAFKYRLPFYIGKAELTWDNFHEVSYIKDDPLPEWNLASGFSLLYPFDHFDLSVHAHQVASRDSLYEKYDDEIYFSENADFSVPITIMQNDFLGELKYAPGCSIEWIWNADHKINSRTEDLARQELLGFHKFYAGKIDWEGNFRKGLCFELKHSAGFNFYDRKKVHGIEADFTGHTHNERVGINFRTKAFYYKNKKLRIGNYLRGIADDQYYGSQSGYDDFFLCATNTAFVFNIDVPIKLFDLDFGESSLKLFNCEVQFSPFVDFALTYSRYNDRYFNLKDGFYCAGFECIVYPKKFKSMQARLSGGVDISRTLLKEYADNSCRQKKTPRYEITFGFDLYF